MQRCGRVKVASGLDVCANETHPAGMSLFSFLFTAIAVLSLTLGRASAASDEAAHPKRLLLIGQGSDGHPPTTHEFMAGVRVLEKLLAPVRGVQTTVVKADEPWSEGPALIDKADGIVMFLTQGAQWMQMEPQRHAA